MLRRVVVILLLQASWATANIVPKLPSRTDEVERFRAILSDSRLLQNVKDKSVVLHMKQSLLLHKLKSVLPKTFNQLDPKNQRLLGSFLNAAGWICDQPISSERLRGVEILIDQIFEQPAAEVHSSPPPRCDYFLETRPDTNSEQEIAEEIRQWGELVRALRELRRLTR